MEKGDFVVGLAILTSLTMDQLSPKPEPSLEDNPFELSESDDDEENGDSSIVKSEDLRLDVEEPKAGKSRAANIGTTSFPGSCIFGLMICLFQL